MSSEFTIKIISRLRARKPAAHLIPFDFFAADGVFGGTVGDHTAAEFFAQGVHCGFDGFLLFLLCVVRAEQVELAVGLRFFGQMQCRDGEEPDRVGCFPQVLCKAERGIVDLAHQVRAVVERRLARKDLKAAVFDADLYAAAVEPVAPQAHRHTVRKQRDAALHLIPACQVAAERRRIANGFDRPAVRRSADGGVVEAVGIAVELRAHFAHQGFEHFLAAF